VTRKALLIGAQDYADPKLRALRSPKQDVARFAQLLRDPEVGFFDDVRTLEETGHTRIREELNRILASAGNGDTVLLYFSCHGIRTQSRTLVFATVDTDTAVLKATGVTASFIHELLSECQASAKIVILDCCHSGAFTKGMRPRSGEYPDIDLEETFGEGTQVLTASQAIEYAYEGDELIDNEPAPSRFTRLLLQGLETGAADHDNDGEIKVEDIFTYIKNELSRTVVGQTPMLYGQVTTPIVLARTRKGRVRADGMVVGGPSAAEQQIPVLLGSLLPTLDEDPDSAGLLARQWPGCGRLNVPVARFASAGGKEGLPLCVELLGGNGHLLVAGGGQAGKTTLLVTLALGLAVTHRPHEVRIYALAGGGPGLGRIRALPHTVTVVDPTRAKDVAWLVDEIGSGLAARPAQMERLGLDDMAEYRDHRNGSDHDPTGDHADVFLLIDGWRESVIDPTVEQLVARVARNGLNYGYHLAVTAYCAAELPTELRPRFRTRLELRLDEGQPSMFDSERAAGMAFARPGWGMDADGRRFRVAVPQLSGSRVETHATRELIARVAESYSVGPVVVRSGADDPLTGDVDFVGLLGIGDAMEAETWLLWKRLAPRDRLRAPFGVKETGEPVFVDLKGMGPHGLCVGATGSGKSELLRTLVLALAVTHSSEYLNFVLCEFKGGATFRALAQLPHTSAAITNLDDLTVVERLLQALTGELNRRQRLLRDAGFPDARDYEEARYAGASLAPMPDLVIVIDEFTELITAKGEFLDLFVRIGESGRSLGVYLLLAAQRLEESRLRRLYPYLPYRLGLKTFSAEESRLVLGGPEAFALPSIPGLGYVKTVGAEDEHSVGTRFKAAYVSWPFRPHDFEPLLDALVGRMTGEGPVAHRIWLPPLSKPPTLDQLLPNLTIDAKRGLTATDYSGTGNLVVPIGIVDRPLEREREVYQIDLSGAVGHAAIVGAARSGKSTLVRTILTALALSHTPEEAQFYCLDFGGGSITGLADLPHMSGVAAGLDVDVVRRIVREVLELLEAREVAFQAGGIDSIGTFRARRARGELANELFGDVFLVVDGWQTFRAEFELLQKYVVEIARRGRTYGIHMIVTASSWGEIRQQLKNVIGTGIELRLGDSFESEVDRELAANVPAARPGRGITPSRFHFLAALPRIDGVQDAADLTDGVAKTVAAIAEAWHGPVAPKLRRLPLLIPYEQMPQASAPLGFFIPLGVDETKLEPVYLDFNTNPHLLIFGEAESGKTSALRTIIRGITDSCTPNQARIVLIDYRRTLLGFVPESHRLAYCGSSKVAAGRIGQVRYGLDRRQPGPDVTQEQLRDRSWWAGPDTFVIVDDYDLVAAPSDNPLAQLAEFLPLGRDLGLHVIIARASVGAGRALFEPVIQQLREAHQPALLLSGDRDEGKLIGDVRLSHLPPGRGTLVSREHGTVMLQTAYLPPEP
jgi:DNA segregation ATPase FtsK/SpoIIIE, S-DNA-T family